MCSQSSLEFAPNLNGIPNDDHDAVVTVLQGGRRGHDTAPAGIVDSETHRENTIARRRPPCGRERLLAHRVAHHSNWRPADPARA